MDISMLKTPDPLTRGSAPESRWGLRPQTPVIGSRSALAMCHPHTGPSRASAPGKQFLPTSLLKATVLFN